MSRADEARLGIAPDSDVPTPNDLVLVPGRGADRTSRAEPARRADRITP